MRMTKLVSVVVMALAEHRIGLAMIPQNQADI